MSAPHWWSQPPGPRGSGAILSSVGVFAVYLGIFVPFVNHHAPGVTQLGCSLLGLPFAAAGTAFLIFGQRAVVVIGNPRKAVTWARWLTVPLLLVAFFAFGWLRWRYAA